MTTQEFYLKIEAGVGFGKELTDPFFTGFTDKENYKLLKSEKHFHWIDNKPYLEVIRNFLIKIHLKDKTIEEKYGIAYYYPAWTFLKDWFKYKIKNKFFKKV